MQQPKGNMRQKRTKKHNQTILPRQPASNGTRSLLDLRGSVPVNREQDFETIRQIVKSEHAKSVVSQK
jgi:hypothetical protein